MPSRLNGPHERSIALVELRHDEMPMPLRLVVGHTIQHGHMGIKWTASQHLKNIGNRGTYSKPWGHGGKLAYTKAER
jgi:hypothetical protein